MHREKTNRKKDREEVRDRKAGEGGGERGWRTWRESGMGTEERERMGEIKVGEWYGSSGANQSKIKCIYIFRWALLVSLSNYFISIFHLHAVKSKSSRPWGKFLSLPLLTVTWSHSHLSLSDSLTLAAAFRYPGHYHTLFVHSQLFSISPLHPLLLLSLTMFYAYEDTAPHVSRNVCVSACVCLRAKVHC